MTSKGIPSNKINNSDCNMADECREIQPLNPISAPEVTKKISANSSTHAPMSYHNEPSNSIDNIMIVSESIVEIKYEYPEVKNEVIEEMSVEQFPFEDGESHPLTPEPESQEDTNRLSISSGETSNSRNFEEDSRLYNLRHRVCNSERKNVESESSDSEAEVRNRTVRCSEPFELTSLSLVELQQLGIGKGTTKYRRNVWKVETSKLDSETYNSCLKTIFKKRGKHLQHLMWKIDAMQEGELEKDTDCILRTIAQSSKALRKVTLDYMSHQDVPAFVDLLSEIYETGGLSNLKFLRLNCDHTGIGISNRGIEALTHSGIPFEQLELEEFQRVDGEAEFAQINNFLDTYKTTLIYLKLGRIYTWNGISAPLEVTFPKMKKLVHLAVSTTWDACSEKGNNKTDDYFQISFSGHLPRLEKLNLGHYVKANEIPFSILKNLKSAELENSWDRCVRFPEIVAEAKASFLQFPNSLRDASFIPVVAKFFPYLKEVSIGFPSQQVLHSFFSHFASSNLQHLSIEFQYDFHNMIEACLFPSLFHSKRNQLPSRSLELIQRYKWSKEFCEHFYVEFPLDANYSNTSTAGLKGLSQLAKLHLSFIGREPVAIPSYLEELRWDDPNCKLLQNVTLGFNTKEGYPFLKECHEEILRLNLDEYTWANIPTLDKHDLPAGYNALT